MDFEGLRVQLTTKFTRESSSLDLAAKPRARFFQPWRCVRKAEADRFVHGFGIA